MFALALVLLAISAIITLIAYLKRQKGNKRLLASRRGQDLRAENVVFRRDGRLYARKTKHPHSTLSAPTPGNVTQESI